MRRAADQRGVALLIVLLLLASVAAIAVGTSALLQRSAGRGAALQQRDRALAALRGAEVAALAYLEQAGQVPQAPVTLPLGEIRVSVAMRPVACLNVNAMVTGAPGALATPQDGGPGVARFQALVTALGGNGPAALPLIEAAQDFIDTDEVPNTGGAEDFDTLRAPVPYRTAGSFLADPSELRAVPGWDRATYAALRPYLCALPTTGPARIDLRYLTPADAPLLAALADNQMRTEDAGRLLENVSLEARESVSAFTALPQLAGTPAGAALTGAEAAGELDVTSSVLSLTATVSQGGAALTMTTLLYDDPGSGWTPLTRKVGL